MLLQLSFIGNRASCHSILFVIILLIKQNRTPSTSNFVNHSFDYRPNKTPLSPITIIYICKINRFVPLWHIHLMVAYHKMQKEEQQYNLLKRSVLLLPRVSMLSFQFHPLVTTSDSVGSQNTTRQPKHRIFHQFLFIALIFAQFPYEQVKKVLQQKQHIFLVIFFKHAQKQKFFFFFFRKSISSFLFPP